MQTILLLPCQLDASISGHADFVLGCLMGFDACGEYSGGPFLECGDVGDFVSFEEDRRCFGNVRSFVCFEAGRHYSCAEIVGGVSSLPLRVGYCLGFLSAFASVSSDLAEFGVAFLSSLVPLLYQEEVQRGFNPLSDVPGQGFGS